MSQPNIPRSPHPVPDAERNLYITQVEALRPDDPPLGVPAEADVNVMKVVGDCLFARSATGSIHGGFGSMSWWATCVSLAMGIGISYLVYYLCDKEIAARIYTGTIGCLQEGVLKNGYFWVSIFAFPVGCFWMYIPWRRQLPIIFNRRTRQVTCYYKGKAYVQDWDSMKAYVKSVRSVHYGGFPLKEGMLAIAFATGRNPESGEETYIRQPICGACHTVISVQNSSIYQAAMIWEYIRLFMREGKEALPPTAYQQEPFMPLPRYCCKNLREVFEKLIPENPLRIKPWWWPLLLLRFLLISLPYLVLTLPTDLAYLCLDRILPRRKWPKELLEACDYVWEAPTTTDWIEPPR
ncbi:MAG: hypothetical protein LBU11_01700 [Zoogloeaceae bacterium]|jgi:hypothetical protein|nr:hypothetical protein [Zoogloeaceae bacterium]